MMRIVFLLTVLLAATFSAEAQCPTPGSDGALTLGPNLGRREFDPVALNIGDSNNVFCFTQVSIGDNTTLVLRARSMRNPNSPVFFYVVNSFTMGPSSAIDLSGESGDLEFTFPAISASGLTATQIQQLRRPSIPGPGGFPGGLGFNANIAAEPGGGPGGGPAGTTVGGATCTGGAASHFGSGNNFGNGSLVSSVIYANPNLLPMYGGSGGGGGGINTPGAMGGVGGAGGGAIRIVASSFSFSSNTRINASGGSGTVSGALPSGEVCVGGPGAGGSIHLVAPGPIPTLGNVLLDVSGAAANRNPNNQSGSGLIRISTGDSACTCSGSVVFGPSFTPPLQTGTPNLRITSIGGVNVPVQPQASYLNPDVRLNTSSAVTIQIASVNIPVGTVVTLRITNETQPDQSITCSPLAGTLASATASCSATFAQLGSMTSVRATW